MQDLWGEEVHPQPTKRKTPQNKGHIDIPLTAQDCRIFGHSFTPAGMSQEKVCQTCGIRGYCPGCTPIAPNQAQPFFCTRHTPESGVHA
jgi:hypothetical protein